MYKHIYMRGGPNLTPIYNIPGGVSLSLSLCIYIYI